MYELGEANRWSFLDIFCMPFLIFTFIVDPSLQILIYCYYIIPVSMNPLVMFTLAMCGLRKPLFASDRDERHRVRAERTGTSEDPTIAEDARPLRAQCDFGPEVHERRNRTLREVFGIANRGFRNHTTGAL